MSEDPRTPAPVPAHDPRARWRTLPAAVRLEELVETQPGPPQVVAEPDGDQEALRKGWLFG